MSYALVDAKLALGVLAYVIRTNVFVIQCGCL